MSSGYKLRHTTCTAIIQREGLLINARPGLTGREIQTKLKRQESRTGKGSILEGSSLKCPKHHKEDEAFAKAGGAALSVATTCNHFGFAFLKSSWEMTNNNMA